MGRWEEEEKGGRRVQGAWLQIAAHLAGAQILERATYCRFPRNLQVTGQHRFMTYWLTNMYLQALATLDTRIKSCLCLHQKTDDA